MDTDIVHALITLHTNAIDARNGYEEALDDAEGRGMTPLFRDMVLLHTTNADELATVLVRLGRCADQNGSFMSTIHRTIMSIRSVLGGLDASVVPGLIDGEKRNASSYAEALRRPDLDSEIRSLLEKQRDRILAAIAAMER